MNEIDTTPPPASKVRIEYSSLHLEEDRDFRHGRSELVDAKSAFTRGLGLFWSGDRPNPNQPPYVITFTSRLLNKIYRVQLIGRPDDLRALQGFITLFHHLSKEREDANAISIRFEARAKAARDKEALEAQKCDSASARRGRRGVTNGPATPLDWRQRTLLGHSAFKCALLEYLGVLNPEGFSHFGALKHGALIQLVEYKLAFPSATPGELTELAA